LYFYAIRFKYFVKKKIKELILIVEKRLVVGVDKLNVFDIIIMFYGIVL